MCLKMCNSKNLLILSYPLLECIPMPVQLIPTSAWSYSRHVQLLEIALAKHRLCKCLMSITCLGFVQILSAIEENNSKDREGDCAGLTEITVHIRFSKLNLSILTNLYNLITYQRCQPSSTTKIIFNSKKQYFWTKKVFLKKCLTLKVLCPFCSQPQIL